MWSKTLKCTYFRSTLAEKAKSDMHSVLNYMCAKYLITRLGKLIKRTHPVWSKHVILLHTDLPNLNDLLHVEWLAYFYY